MKYKHFVLFNDAAKEDGVIPDNYLCINSFSDENNKIIATSHSEKKVTYKVNELIDSIIKYGTFTIDNPEILKDSKYISDYVIDRKIHLEKKTTQHFVYNEKFDKGLNNPELEQTEYVITVEQWRATNSGGKVELLRENLLYMYLDCGEDKEKTFNVVWKKINEKVKDTWVLALSNKETVWLQKLLKDEIDRVNCF